AGAVEPRHRPTHRAGGASHPLVLPSRPGVPEDPSRRRTAPRGVRHHPEPFVPQLRVLVELVRPLLPDVARAAGARAGVPLSPPLTPDRALGIPVRALPAEGPAPPPGPARPFRRLPRRGRHRHPSRPAGSRPL